MARTMTALYKSVADADRVLAELDKAGFGSGNLSLAVVDRSEGLSFSFVRGTRWREKAAQGALLGGLLGLVAALVFLMVFNGAGTAFPSAIGWMLVGSAVAALGALGFLIGAIVGHRRERYEVALRPHGEDAFHSLIGVRVHKDEREAARTILDRYEKRRFVNVPVLTSTGRSTMEAQVG